MRLVSEVERCSKVSIDREIRPVQPEKLKGSENWGYDIRFDQFDVELLGTRRTKKSSLQKRRWLLGFFATKSRDSKMGINEPLEEVSRLVASCLIRCRSNQQMHGSSGKPPLKTRPSCIVWRLSYDTSWRNWRVYLLDILTGKRGEEALYAKVKIDGFILAEQILT